MFAIREVSGKGLGLLATKTIKQGNIILVEMPVFSVEFKDDYESSLINLCEAFDDLNDDSKDQFSQLFDPDKKPARVRNMTREKIVRIFLANCVDIKTFNDEEDFRGVYLNFSRLNHACDANGVISWSRRFPSQLIVRASRDIIANEEITINYIRDEHGFSRREVRQDILSRTWNFTCNCNLCSLTGDKLKHNEEVRQSILDLEEELNQYDHPAYQLSETAFKLEKLKLDHLYSIKSEIIHKLPFSLLECYAFGLEMQLNNFSLSENVESIKQSALEEAELLGESFTNDCEEMLSDISTLMKTFYNKH